MIDVCNLKKPEVDRYARQIILPVFGINGQISLKDSRILIVGCGGLGCPSGIYLAGAGIGTIGLVDHDIVDESNLHRQICHKESKIGKSKVESLSESLKMLNSSINIEQHKVLLNNENAIDIIINYDVVLDCTDNVVTRYLINDCCVILKKPLVSASALGLEGQLTVYNYENGPCYRCLFPVPPPANTVTNCNEGGVLGTVPGMLGTLQATETIKIITQIGSTYSGKMLLYDAETGNFRNIKLRPRNINCEVCGENPSIREPIDYQKFCNAKPSDACGGKLSILSPCDRISVSEYSLILETNQPHILIDVRPQVQIDTCRFTNAIQLQMSQLNSREDLTDVFTAIQTLRDSVNSESSAEVYIICRSGNNSQIAVEKLRKHFDNENIIFKDITGGMRAWAAAYNPDLPVY